jgi:hypothetical protein
MILKKEDIVIILKAGGLALLWVLIITYTTFPKLFGDPVSFLSEQINFENTGKYLLFGAGIYVFDLWVQIVYFVNKQLKRNFFVAGALGCAVLCLLIVPFAIEIEMSRIYPILMVGLSMGFLKGYSFYCNKDIVFNDMSV